MSPEAVFEIYKILVTLAGVLIAASITAYSIAISVLGPERAKLEAQIEEIRRKADDKFRRGKIKDSEAAEREVRSAKIQIGKIMARLSRLSLRTVVVMPGIPLTLCIYGAVEGMLAYPTLERIPLPVATQPGFFVLNAPYWQVSAGLLVVGGALLVFALYGIEKAAGEIRLGRTQEA